jgi:hypothetical protein
MDGKLVSTGCPFYAGLKIFHPVRVKYNMEYCVLSVSGDGDTIKKRLVRTASETCQVPAKYAMLSAKRLF